MKMYRQWEAEVDKFMVDNYGVGVDDIPDMPYRDWWKDCMSAKEAADEAIRIVNEGGF
jgi:hypothetical protein